MKATDLKKQDRSTFSSRELVTVAPQTRLEDALALMTKHDIHHLPVVEGEKLVGLLVDRDVLSAFITAPEDDSSLTVSYERNEREHSAAVEERLSVRERPGQASASLVVERYMQRNIPTIDDATDVREALSRMLSSHVTALPVLREGKLVGIITETDMLRLLDSMLRRGEPLEQVALRGEALLANPLVQNVLKSLSDYGI